MINSNLGLISYRFGDMSSFPLKNPHFYPLCSTPNLNMFFLHCIPQILYAESLDRRLIQSRQKGLRTSWPGGTSRMLRGLMLGVKRFSSFTKNIFII